MARPSMLRTAMRAAVTASVAVALCQPAAAAPRAWLLPSDTVFAGTGDEWMTVDAAISSDLYFYDHPGQSWVPVVTAPDGSIVAVENAAKGRLRQTFDLHLTQRGTYRISVFNEAVTGSYMQDGERRMLPRGTTPATLAQAIPAGATDVQTAVSRTRIETFATAGEPDATAFRTDGKGIEMVPVTNPTDLVVGEAATFQFLKDGRPAAGYAVTTVNGGVRYAKGLTQRDTVTGTDGKVTLTFPAAGMWWVNVAARRDEAPRPAPAPVAGAAEAPRGPGGSGGPPRARDSYVMTVQVLGD